MASRRSSRTSAIAVGSDAKTGELILLSPKWLGRHVHVLGPTGVGKSRFNLLLASQLYRQPHATVIIMNGKGAFGFQARDLAIRAGMSRRLISFDPAEQQRIVGFNPLRPNGIDPATHAKAVREAIRSSWGQDGFDQFPQLARYLYLALRVARDHELTLVEAVRLLRPQSELRTALLARAVDPHVQEALAYLETLRPARQDELVASTLARLEAFVMDPILRRIVVQQARGIDLDEVLQDHRILIVDLPIYRPLRPDDVRLVGRLFLNQLVNHVFSRSGRPDPVYVIADEAHYFAGGDFATILDEGREVGLHFVFSHQRMAQLLKEDPSGALLDAVRTCQTKVVFGGISGQDAELLLRDLMLDEIDPWRVKDEIESLEIEPVETTREQVSEGVSVGVNRNHARGTSGMRTSTRTRGTTRQTGEMGGESHSRGWARSHGRVRTSHTSASSSYSCAVNGACAVPQNFGMTEGEASGEGEIESSSVGRSKATIRARSRARGVHGSESHASSVGHTESESEGTALTTTHTRTTVPFHELRKRRVVSKRTFLSEPEQLTLHEQQVRGQGTGECVLKVPGHRARFLRVPYVAEPQVSESRRKRILDRVYSEPFYSTPDAIDAEEQGRTQRLIGTSHRPAEPDEE